MIASAMGIMLAASSNQPRTCGVPVWRRFGVEYTLAEMDVLPHRIGWSVQVPARRAAERDEAAIAGWRE